MLPRFIWNWSGKFRILQSLFDLSIGACCENAARPFSARVTTAVDTNEGGPRAPLCVSMGELSDKLTEGELMEENDTTPSDLAGARPPPPLRNPQQGRLGGVPYWNEKIHNFFYSFP